MSEQNKQIHRRTFEAVIAQRDVDALDTLYSEDVIYHGPDGELRGIDSLKQMIQGYLTAFSTMELSIGEQVAEGELVVTRATVSGTFDGPMGDIPPTGKSATIQMTAMGRIQDGRIVEEWEVFDQLGMLQQLGVIPTEAGA